MHSFYSREGDDGTTGLLGDRRVPKYHPIPEAIGILDEASAALGLARATCQVSESAEVLLTVQRDLYSLMAEVAASPENAVQFRKINPERIEWLETQIDQLGERILMPDEFIVPGDSLSSASLALARTVVRRAERQVVRLFYEGLLENQDLLRYLNRLSSLCFVLEILEISSGGSATISLAKKKGAS